ncbi:MAG TPA: helix-hairpin-helix domain-containing protein, partial [Dehalococcoidia bacterium]|nr:helix-hairpin-helix domain-containing protein [Dehalococcoidia bacterium]
DIPRQSRTLHILQWVRDEAHRFAIGYHKKIRGRQTTGSELDDISGIGKQKKRLLLRTFGSVKNIKKVSYEDLCKVNGINTNLAARIKQFLHD